MPYALLKNNNYIKYISQIYFLYQTNNYVFKKLIIYKRTIFARRNKKIVH